MCACVWCWWVKQGVVGGPLGCQHGVTRKKGLETPMKVGWSRGGPGVVQGGFGLDALTPFTPEGEMVAVW